MNKTKIFTVTDAQKGQRIDNFLLTFYKGVPKSRIYRALRQGEVRVNSARIKPPYRLEVDDKIRIPPLRVSEIQAPAKVPDRQLQAIEESIIYEDEGLLILNKPAGMAVHGGSGINFGVIETIRQCRPQAKFLELVHRLDRDTSGCLMIAKKRNVLVSLHEILREKKVKKIYLALVKGQWKGGTRKVKAALLKNQLQSGERIVRVQEEEGKPSISLFEPLHKFENATLMKITLQTGRTHQIRVHAAHIDHPIACDDKYGDKEFNRQMRQKGLKRLFLHAAEVGFHLESKTVAICACLDISLSNLLQKMYNI